MASLGNDARIFADLPVSWHPRVMHVQRILAGLAAASTMAASACGGKDGAPMPNAPTPPPTQVTANAYILPDAVSLNGWAFGDEPVVVYASERLRWVNFDTLTHAIVADSPDATDFRMTGELRTGGEQSVVMTRLGTTRIHCAIHPNMTGTLIVRER